MAELSGQQVLVTGGAGFVGRSVVRALAQQRARVTVVDLQPFPDGDVRSVVGEITDPATRDAAVHEGLDGIVHLAAALHRQPDHRLRALHQRAGPARPGAAGDRPTAAGRPRRAQARRDARRGRRHRARAFARLRADRRARGRPADRVGRLRGPAGRPRAGHPGAAAVSAAAPPRAERWRDRWARAGAAARRHWLILAILAPAIALRVLAQLAYKPLLLYIDSYVYLANLHRLDPT